MAFVAAGLMGATGLTGDTGLAGAVRLPQHLPICS